jgi:hypothetical protein
VPADKGDRRKLAAWTRGKPHTVTLAGRMPAGKASGTAMTCESFPPGVVGKNLLLELTAAPKYVTRAVTSREPAWVSCLCWQTAE